MVALVSPRDEIMGRHTTTRMNSTDRYIGKSLWAPDGILRSEGWSRWSKKKKQSKDGFEIGSQFRKMKGWGHLNSARPNGVFFQRTHANTPSFSPTTYLRSTSSTN